MKYAAVQRENNLFLSAVLPFELSACYLLSGLQQSGPPLFLPESCQDKSVPYR